MAGAPHWRDVTKTQKPIKCGQLHKLIVGGLTIKVGSPLSLGGRVWLGWCPAIGAADLELRAKSGAEAREEMAGHVAAKLEEAARAARSATFQTVLPFEAAS